MVYPLLRKCSNFQITEFSPALETNFESIFVLGGYNQGGRGLDHFASEPFKYSYPAEIAPTRTPEKVLAIAPSSYDIPEVLYR